jgi:hypothetical protein
MTLKRGLSAYCSRSIVVLRSLRKRKGRKFSILVASNVTIVFLEWFPAVCHSTTRRHGMNQKQAAMGQTQKSVASFF